VVVGGGIGIGLLLGAVTARLLENQIHGIQPLDLITFGLACTAMAAGGLVATCWPAARAASRARLGALNES
jgi:hypothetical protein